MRRKNTNSKTVNNQKPHVLDHDPTPQELTGVIVQLREIIDDVRTRVFRQFNEALELCEEAINPTVIKPKKPVVKPVDRPITPTVMPKKSAKKAFRNLANSRKKTSEAANPRDTADNPSKVSVPTATAPASHRRLPMSVRLTPHEVTLNVGSHPVKALADNDAKDFIGNPRVFWYRAMQFPDPRRYQVQPRIENVRVVKRTDKRFENAPWTCSVTVTLVGDTKRCENWGLAFYTKNKSEQE